MTQEVLMERLCALVPRPRKHLAHARAPQVQGTTPSRRDPPWDGHFPGTLAWLFADLVVGTAAIELTSEADGDVLRTRLAVRLRPVPPPAK